MYSYAYIDIFIYILIYTGYFTDKGSEDLATMREGLKLSRKLANSESFAKYKGEEIFPGKHVQNDDELDAYIRDVSLSIF
jgi:choline dehydrogenase-like flavoprotein